MLGQPSCPQAATQLRVCGGSTVQACAFRQPFSSCGNRGGGTDRPGWQREAC